MSTQSFTADDLREMVRLIGKELKCEDAVIRAATSSNAVYQQCRGVGITYLKSEWYYRAVAVRALLPTFRFRVQPEYRITSRSHPFDLGFFGESSPEPVALGEIKLWMSDTAEQGIPSMIKDCGRLATVQCPTFLLVFTANPTEETTKNLQYLVGRLDGLGEIERYEFSTPFVHHGGCLKEGEFAIVAGLLSSGQLATAR